MVIDYVCLVITPKGCTNKILSKKKQKNLLKLWKGIWNNISANWLCSWKKNPKWTEKLHQSAESFFLCLGWGVRTARLKWYSSVLNFFFFSLQGFFVAFGRLWHLCRRVFESRQLPVIFVIFFFHILEWHWFQKQITCSCFWTEMEKPLPHFLAWVVQFAFPKTLS